MKGFVLAAVILGLVVPAAARATSLVLYDGVATADIGAAAPLGIDPTLGNPNGGYGGGLLTGDIGFTALVGGKVTVTVTDLGNTADGRAGSVYQALLDGAALGLTSPTAIGAAAFSTGAFETAVAAGFHSVGVWDFLSTYVGYQSPYGGFVDGAFSQADLSVQVVESVPEPGSIALLGMGLVSLSGMVRNRKRVAL